MQRKPLLCYILNSFSYWCVNSNTFNKLLGTMSFKGHCAGEPLCDALTVKVRRTLSKEEIKLWNHVRAIVSCYNEIMEGSWSGECLAKELVTKRHSNILN